LKFRTEARALILACRVI